MILLELSSKASVFPYQPPPPSASTSQAVMSEVDDLNPCLHVRVRGDLFK